MPDAILGGDPSGENTSDAAFVAALAAVGGRGRIIVPPGRFTFASPITYTLPSAAVAFSIVGSGARMSTLEWPNIGGLDVTFTTNTQTLHVRDLSLLTGVAGGGTALAVTNASGAMDGQQVSDVTDVTIGGIAGGDADQYWDVGIDSRSLSFINLRGLTVLGGAGNRGAGVRLTACAAQPGIVYNFSGVSLEFLAFGIVTGDWVQGVNIAQSNFSGAVGIFVPPDAASPGSTQLTVSGNQFGPIVGPAVEIDSAFPDFMFRDNLVLSSAGANGVRVAVAQRGSIVGNHFVALDGGGTAITIGPPGHPAIGGLVANNMIGSYATGIDLGEGSTGWRVQGNHDLGNGTFIRDAGVDNTVS